ncbi:cyanophycinase [Halomonas binhaiensis]|uniref:Cyanophycinase n=1 Tax=Halomonas binhaiensis TaxID=2562282 RepID=A0A5C1NAM5_9GAMM|nr:cyanophycinase [Halomonas binhaiensis]QEM80131.1 cyanophycinase [Halomonas binhaiensis]
MLSTFERGHKRHIITLLAGLMTLPMLFAPTAQAASQGGLVIVGGALRASNTAVYERFIDMAGGRDSALIGVIPAASGKPSRNGQKFIDDMIAMGVPADHLTLMSIAVIDDSSTEDIDESQWADNGDDPKVAETIAQQTAIWMIGGDQMRLRQTLMDTEGSPTPAAQAISEVFQSGGVIGGTSAGAAIMSDIMIASGDSYGALSEGFTDSYGSMDEQEFGPVYLDKGLGLFPYGIIDQHFDRKARYGRLITTSFLHREQYPMGFGIEENTALVVAEGIAEVLGDGGVHVIDTSQAQHGDDGSFSNVRLSYFQPGDQWRFGEGYVNASDKHETGGNEYYHTPTPIQTGVFSRNGSLRDFIGYDLIDNEAATSVASYLLNPETDTGFRLDFQQGTATRGYWKALDGQADSYSYVNVRLDISPVSVEIKQ